MATHQHSDCSPVTYVLSPNKKTGQGEMQMDITWNMSLNQMHILFSIVSSEPALEKILCNLHQASQTGVQIEIPQLSEYI